MTDANTGSPNGDETGQYLGNFHKSLPHDAYGLVITDDYEEFRDTCIKIDKNENLDFEHIARGQRDTPPADGCPYDRDDRDLTAKFVSPLAGAATETLGPDPKLPSTEMLPAPVILSESSAAEMVELYWMALMRDVPLAGFEDHDLTKDAVEGIRHAYTLSQNQDNREGSLQLGLDLPKTREGAHEVLDIRPETLFGCGLKGEDQGPWINQFFLQDIPYGTQTIDTRQVPYKQGRDYMTTFEEWLNVQNGGTDPYGRSYGKGNFFCDDNDYYATGHTRHISTFRDMARFVNRDALHQAYFNAALLLDGIGAKADAGNPYPTTRSDGFATLGGPDLLTLVSEVASRALKVVWRQKWLVHRRCRPEAFGGLLHVQEIGNAAGDTMDFGIGNIVKTSTAASMIRDQHQSLLLPMAYSAGSPNHPAYGAGHATVAGACATILKAWFDENQSLRPLLEGKAAKEPGPARTLLQPGAHRGGESFDPPGNYTGDDLTVGGEINKLASNVAMGRSIGGVHWRSDNTRSLRLGEKIAMHILRTRASEYAENNVSFSFESFDRQAVCITPGNITVDGEPVTFET